jgi:hypothetical protein
MQHKLATRPSVSTRTTDFAPSELPLSDVRASSDQSAPRPVPKQDAATRIREALRRWFDREL